MKTTFLSIGLAGVCAVLAYFWWVAPRGHLLVRWTMANVNQNAQGDAHLVEFVHGPTLLIDAGLASESGALLSLLRKRGVRVLDSVWITHAHRDHYGGVTALVHAGIVLKEVRMNLPEKDLCESEQPWGCSSSDLELFSQTLRAADIPLRAIPQGYELDAGSAGKLSVLYAYDGISTPVGKTDINDTSLVVLLSSGKTRALFTGDLNALVGGFLAREGKNLQANILKVPHHGTDSVAPNAFFDKVASEVAMVPSPRVLWASDRSRRVRDYFRDSGQKVFINGFNGNVEVLIGETGYRVLPDYF